MKKQSDLTITIISLLLVISLPAYPHSGRTDKDGGHYDRKTGQYHFHRSPSTPSPSQPAKPSMQWTLVQVFVTRVVDGDTFIARFPHGMEERVRLSNLNAPEPKEPGGPEATAELKFLIEGKDVILRIRAANFYPRDKFGRILAEINK